MIDANKIIVSRLNEIGLKVYLEDFLDSATPIPCLSYREYDNAAYKEGDTIGYSTLTYHIKVWGKSMQDLTKYSTEVDKIMRSLGFERINKAPDLWLDGIGQRDLKYTNLALEIF